MHEVGGHHVKEDFAVRGKEPKDEVHIYTWMDTTPRELTDQVKEVAQAARKRDAKLSSAFVDKTGRFVVKGVALHLLSEREKNDLAQLVDTMVSSSITYKHSKPDAPELSLDPPIDNFVRFKDYQSEYVGLSLAMKQILVHEVEKQRILHESTGRANDKITPSINSTTATGAGSSQLKVAPNKRQSLASITPNSSEINKSFPANGKPSKTPEVKRPVRTSSSFFDSFRKGSGKESRGPGEIVPKAATVERDSRPLLFKYNEGFTNAVKRPVKIRELLL